MEQLDQLATALCKAQAAFPAVPKSGKNPFLKNEYATLDDIIGAVRGPLGDNGLSFVQLLSSEGAMVLRTILLHESGQSLESAVDVTPGPAKGVNDLQALGAAITYMKRYTLGAMLGIATDGDTDGEGAPKGAGKQTQQPAPTPEPTNRPLDGEAVRNAIRQKAQWQNNTRVDGEPITVGQLKSIPSLMGEAVMVHGMTQALADKARHDVLSYLVGVNSTANLTKKEASAIIAWLKEGDSWDLNQYAKQEAANVLTALSIEAGQQEMEL